MASYGVGLARGLVSSVLRAASGTGGPAHAEWVAPPQPLSEEAVEPVEHVEPPTPLFPQAAPQRRPAEPGESFATEPTAVTRDSAHGGRGADAEIDDWYGERSLDDDETPSGVVEALEFGDRLTPVEADIKAILSDADLLRRAAERPGERD